MSQEYIALRLGISQCAYSKLERGDTRMTLDKLDQLLKVFEMDLSDLLRNDFKIS